MKSFHPVIKVRAVLRAHLLSLLSGCCVFIPLSKSGRCYQAACSHTIDTDGCGFHPVIKVLAVLPTLSDESRAVVPFSSRYQSPGGATDCVFSVYVRLGEFSSRYQSPGGATHKKRPQVINKDWFSSRYQSPGGATFCFFHYPFHTLRFHPVIKVRAVLQKQIIIQVN